jgi:uncharacterized protein YoxC
MSYLDKLIERRDAVKVEMDEVLEAVAAENRTDLTEEEAVRVDTLVEESKRLADDIQKFKAQMDTDEKVAGIRSAVKDVVMPKSNCYNFNCKRGSYLHTKLW